jgi:hypothetical protein
MKANQTFPPQTRERVKRYANRVIVEIRQSTDSEAKIWLLLILCAWAVVAITLLGK